MKDILQDIVAHTHALGFLTLVKVTNDETTSIDSMAEDRSVILSAETHSPVNEFEGTFGMPNLDKLSLHLKNPEYKDNAKVDVVKAERNGEIELERLRLQALVEANKLTQAQANQKLGDLVLFYF